MREPCEEFDVVYNANQTQNKILKNTLINLFQHRLTIPKNEDDSSKPIKKKIRLSNSSKRNSKDINSI